MVHVPRAVALLLLMSGAQAFESKSRRRGGRAQQMNKLAMFPGINLKAWQAALGTATLTAYLSTVVVPPTEIAVVTCRLFLKCA